MNTAFVSDGDIALIEHKLLCELASAFTGESTSSYLLGVCDLAEAVIDFIRTKYPNDKGGDRS